MKIRRRCKCGCGRITLPGRIFIHGHNSSVIDRYGENNPFYGKRHSIRNRVLWRIKHKKRYKDGRVSWNKGIKMPKETIAKIVRTRKQNDSYKQKEQTKRKIMLSLIGPKSPNWKGGIAAEPYCDEWKDHEFKNDILERDNYKCQNPYCWRNSKRICIHHIDHIKKNCHPKNLITTCYSCNLRARHKPKSTKIIYQRIIRRKYA